MYNCMAASLTLWKSDFMVCWKGDPSSRATRSAARSAAVWGHPSNKDPGSSWQVRQALENKHMAWQNRNVSGHGRAFGNATNSRKFQRGERETRFHSPTSSESLEPDAPSNPQPWTFKWNVVHYRNRARRNIWRTKDWFYMSRISTAKQKKWFNDHPPKHAWRWKNGRPVLPLGISEVNVSPLDCSSANFSLPESWSMKLVEKNLWPPEERTSHYSQLAVQKWGATWRT